MVPIGIVGLSKRSRSGDRVDPCAKKGKVGKVLGLTMISILCDPTTLHTTILHHRKPLSQLDLERRMSWNLVETGDGVVCGDAEWGSDTRM